MIRNILHRRVVIAHSFPLVVAALAAIAGEAGFDVVAHAGDATTADAAIRNSTPDIALLGLTLAPAIDDGLRSRGLSSRLRTILLCDDLDPAPLLAATEGGAAGMLLSTAPTDTVLACLNAVAAGSQWLDPAIVTVVLDSINRRTAPAPSLTRRERDVTRLVAAGQRNRTIADALGISEGTVKMHLHNVYAKLGLESRTQLAMDQRARAA